MTIKTPNPNPASITAHGLTKRHANQRDWQRWCDDVGHSNLRTQKRYAQHIRSAEGEMSCGRKMHDKVQMTTANGRAVIRKIPVDRPYRILVEEPTYKAPMTSPYIAMVRKKNKRKRAVLDSDLKAGLICEAQYARKLKRIR